jgi:ATP-dependent RNA helicase DeaD
MHHNRFETLRRLLDFTPGIYGIIFTRTKQDCQDISEKLMRMGYHVSPLHGDMDQKMRSKVMERFKSKALQCIVATDVAARGIDVNDITHVINYELPDDPEVYTHRSGRTARAGKSGICMSIVTPKEISSIRQIERLNKTAFHKSDIPDGAEVVRKRLFHFLHQIENSDPQDKFAEVYHDAIHQQFESLDKDELIRRLIWLQLKDTIQIYNDAEDLNAGYNNRPESRSRGGERSDRNSVRLFINLGMKDGIKSADQLLKFITESTDMQPDIISRITVRDLSSFFNVEGSAANFLVDSLSQKKFKGRKVRLEEAEQRDRDRASSGGGGYSKGPSNRRPGGDSRPPYREGRDSGRDGGRDGSRKFNKRY